MSLFTTPFRRKLIRLLTGYSRRSGYFVTASPMAGLKLRDQLLICSFKFTVLCHGKVASGFRQSKLALVLNHLPFVGVERRES